MNSDQVIGNRPDEDAAPVSAVGGEESTTHAQAADAASEINDRGQSPSAARSERERTFARRALIQAGWSVPVITGLVFPRQVSASQSHPFIDHHDFTDRHRGP